MADYWPRGWPGAERFIFDLPDRCCVVAPRALEQVQEMSG